MESAWPRTIAASRLVILRAGSGNRALPGDSPGRSAANVTSSSGAFAIARRHDVTARLNGSVGASREPVRNLELDGVVIARSSLPRRADIAQCDDTIHDRIPVIRAHLREHRLRQAGLAQRIVSCIGVSFKSRLLDA